MQDRLGCQPDTGFQDILSHSFYAAVDWEALNAKQVVSRFSYKHTVPAFWANNYA